jgi:hypothetical protein
MAHRLTIAVVLLALLCACAPARVVRLDTGDGAPREYRLPTSNNSVKVDADAFEEALTNLVLEVPLTLRSPRQGWLVRASYSSDGEDTRWRSLMSRSFGSKARGASHPQGPLHREGSPLRHASRRQGFPQRLPEMAP